MCVASVMAKGIKEGKIGAFSMEDKETSGYYLVEWRSEAYTLQEDTVLTEFDPPLELQAGELVVDATYLKLVPRAKLPKFRAPISTTFSPITDAPVIKEGICCNAVLE